MILVYNIITMDNVVAINEYNVWESPYIERTAIGTVKDKFYILEGMTKNENLPIEKRNELEGILKSLKCNVDWENLPREELLEIGLIIEDLRAGILLPSYSEIKAELWEIILKFPKDPPKQKATL